MFLGERPSGVAVVALGTWCVGDSCGSSVYEGVSLVEVWAMLIGGWVKSGFRTVSWESTRPWSSSHLFSHHDE